MTASIDALLDHAHHQLPGERITKFKERRIALIATLESNGIPYNDLYAFRTTEMAHSIQRSQPSESKLPLFAITEFAHDTYELILEIDDELVLSGSQSYLDLPDLYQAWKDRGGVFWADREVE